MKTISESISTIPCDPTASYLQAVFSELRRDHSIYYVLLDHAPLELFQIHLMFDYRLAERSMTTRWDYDEPFCSFTLCEFFNRAGSFHENDTFTIQFDGMLFGCESDFNVQVVECLYTEYIREHCSRFLHRNIRFVLTDADAGKSGLRDSELSGINALLDSINREIIADLQMQYDILKRLDFIKK